MSRDIAPICISRVEATTHTVSHLRSHIASASADVCFVNLQLSGSARYSQRHHEQFCGPGDLAVVDTEEPFEIVNRRDFQLFCFALPRGLLPRHFSDRPALKLSGGDAGHALSRTLAGYAGLALDAGGQAGVARFAAAHVVELIAHAPQILAGAPDERLSAPSLLSMMLEYIDRHCSDPGLGAAALARRFR